MEFTTQLLSTLIAFTLSSLSTHLEIKEECGDYKEYKYCYYPGASENNTLIYFLHGFGNNPTSWKWNSVTKKMEKTWEDLSSSRPNVVSVTKKNFWWYISKNDGKQLKQFADWIEGEKLKATHLDKLDRVVYGDSMGGHNAMRWAADYPTFFDRVAMICPAIPFSLSKTQRKTGILPMAFGANQVIKSIYKKNQQNPGEVLNTLLYKKDFPKKVHLAVSNRDEFGFYRGGLELFKVLSQKKNLQIILNEQRVRHCNIKADTLAGILNPHRNMVANVQTKD